MASSNGSSDSIVIQERDIALLRSLLECRVMTTDHVSDIHFEGRREMAKKRLQKLKAAGFIGERKRHASAPAVLFLTRKGIGPLQTRGVLAEYPAFDIPALERRARVGALTLAHELEVMAVKAAFHASARKATGLEVLEFNTWPLLNQFTAYNARGEEVLVKPDAFLRIQESDPASASEYSFFLEVDRSTETQAALVGRVSCYLDHYRSGGFAERLGASRDAVKEHPFRVLFVLKTAERRNNTIEELLQYNPSIKSFVYLTTLDEVTKDPFGPIWIKPHAYQHALSGTPFALADRAAQHGYRRKTARDVFVETSVPKSRLQD